jgi:hypothetical protein
MNRINILIILTIVLSFSSCSDWLEIENVVSEDEISVDVVKDDEYYENLCTWKDEMFYEHTSKFFYSWWGWLIPEEENSLGENYISSLPDSLGMISLWADKSGKAYYAEDRYQDELVLFHEKGSKMVICVKASSIGVSTDNCVDQDIVDSIHARAEYYGFLDLFTLDDYPDSLRNWPRLGTFEYDDSPDFYEELLDFYVLALISRMDSLNMDGYDFDHEPTWEPQSTANLWTDADYFNYLLEELSEHIGPCAATIDGKKKFLIVDGELTDIDYDNMHRISYFFPQTYSVSSNSGVQSRSVVSYVLDAYEQSDCRLTFKGLAERVAPGEMTEGSFTTFFDSTYTDKWMGLSTFMAVDDDDVYYHSAGCGKFTGLGSYYDSDYPYETYPWLTRVIRELAGFRDEYEGGDGESVKDEYEQDFIDNDWWPVTYDAADL